MMPNANDKNFNLALLIIKPEAKIAPYDKIIPDKINQMLFTKGLEIIAQKELMIDEGILRSYQPVLNRPSEYGEDWKMKMIQVATENNISATILIVQGNDAINKCMKIKKEIREEFVDNTNPINKIVKNFVHCTDRFEEVMSNIQVLFSKMLSFLNQKFFIERDILNKSIMRSI
jgi:nucleoside diphosphate kinase